MKHAALSLVFLIFITNSSLAEYKAITEETNRYAVKDENGNRPITKFDLSVDETDLEACKIIATNINHLNQFKINWNCGMPISPNIFSLGRPSWAPIYGEEKKRAISRHCSLYPNVYCNLEDPREFYKTTYGNSSPNKNIEMYLMWPDEGPTCKSNATNVDSRRPAYWLSEGYQWDSIQQDIVTYKSRFYFVEYETSFEKTNDFFVYALKENGPQTAPDGTPAPSFRLAGMCKIKPSRDK